MPPSTVAARPQASGPRVPPVPAALALRLIKKKYVEICEIYVHSIIQTRLLLGCIFTLDEFPDGRAIEIANDLPAIVPQHRHVCPEVDIVI